MTIMLLIIATTSCCKPYRTSLTKEQIDKFVVEMPDYPKKETFSDAEQKYIAGIPTPLKIYIFEAVQITKCIKYNKCEN